MGNVTSNPVASSSTAAPSKANWLDWAIIGVTATVGLAGPLPFPAQGANSSPLQRCSMTAPTTTNQVTKSEGRRRYEAIASSDWFREAYEGRSLGGAMEID